MERKPSFSPSSSSSPPAKRFDVFLSFRGEDTRKTFTSHLSSALSKMGLVFNIFKDDIALHKGKEIGPELLNAIKDSRYAVVVLSKNYADSHWCLKELAKIVECMGDSGRIRTIFYHVDPSDVRNPKGSFGKGLQKLEKDPRHSPEEVRSWRKALTKVANQSGKTVHSLTDEKIFIEKFVSEISSELSASLLTMDGLFGMSSRLEKLDSYVHQSFATSNVCLIGIHGMGGIGKSTLATAYYKQTSHKFEGSSFLQNVREFCEKKKPNGLVDLQKQLLSKILEGDFEHIDCVGVGRDIIKSRLRNKKVLIILDDVNEEDQLDALAGDDYWFGSGSIIIVTTRDDSFLKNRKYKIYEAEYLNSIEALQLFSWKAFRSIEPPDQEYKGLSQQVVKYASYLPLALTVLGSLLGSKEKSLWNSALHRLSNNPEAKIIEKLKISFDDLNPTDKCIFLDIACLYNRCDIETVREILGSCWFDLEYGISNLIDKSLLSINKYGISKIWMHDLLEEMGKDIVRKESGNELARQSRIWNSVDFYQILENKKGTNEIEAIRAWEYRRTNITAEYAIKAFSHMKKLRLLDIRHLDFYVGQDYCNALELSNDLQYLGWGEFPFKKLPSNFQPPNLVRLILRESNIKQLWNNIGNKPLNNLKVIDLSYSYSFTKFDDFTVVPNLEKLILSLCEKLSEIHPSIKHLKKLILLDLEWCSSLKELPAEINGLVSLETLDLYNCFMLDKLPDNFEQLTSLRKLRIEASALRNDWPSSIFDMENLESVHGDTTICKWLKSVIREKIIKYHTTGKCIFPSWFFTYSYLLHLDLSDCNLDGPEAFPECFKKFVRLFSLNLSKNPFSVLPHWINKLSRLTTLKLEHCKSLGCVEAELLPSSLDEIYVNYCTSLASFLDPLKPCHLRCSKQYCLDCTELVNRQDGNMTALASLSSFLDQDPKERRLKNFEFVVPQTKNELPSWFINQSSTASISIKLDSNRRNGECFGFAMVFCFRANSSTQDNFSCNLRLRGSLNWETTMEVGVIKSRTSDHLFLHYCSFRKQPKPPSFFGEGLLESIKLGETLEFSFFSTEGGSSCGPCGVRLVYEEDIEELKQITSQYYNAQKDVQSSQSQSIGQVSKFRQMDPIGSPFWTGLRGILDLEDNLLLDLPNNTESNSSVVGNIHFGVFRNYSGITAKFLDK